MEAVLDFSNRFDVRAMRSAVCVHRAAATQSMTPDEALCFAAWLVAVAEPLAELTFAEVAAEVRRET